MSEYQHYTGRGSLFGLGFPGADGEFGSPHDEGAKVGGIERLFGALLGALGAGIFSGGVGSISGGDLQLSAVSALVEDELGTVPIADTAQVIAATQFAEGLNYVHLQAGENARADGECGYYVSGSEVPPSGGVLVCGVKVEGGALTAVDNAVRMAPEIVHRIPLLDLMMVMGGTQTARQFLTAALGAAYLGATPPASVADRLMTLEALITGGVGGGGGTGPIFAALLAMSATDQRLVPQFVTDTVNDAIAAAGVGTTGGSGGAAATSTLRDDDSYNLGMLVLELTQWLPDAPVYQRNAATIRAGVYGDGSGADGLNFVGEGSEW